MWEPKTFEDQLLKRYLDDNPGKLYLEVSVSFMTELKKARRIDGVLIPGEEATVYPQGSYSIGQFREDIKGPLPPRNTGGHLQPSLCISMNTKQGHKYLSNFLL